MLPMLRDREGSVPRLSRLDQLFNETLADWFGGRVTEALERGGWFPAVDIREEEGVLTFVADLPGLERDDVEVTLENNVLTVKGERRSEVEEKRDTYHRVERSFGAFTRSFALPHGVDAGKVSAKFTNGVLTLTIPKTEAAKPHKISIR
jgi:HSP20 family protein